ncbi:MAG: sodium:proton antiporter [Hadesarchaea archaeon]|nr:MAG: sodium:proton antiporter [Hadesarchaea archaeon]TEU15469.1 MAG: sodium:proton antiporter [Hadesarchaea archaeon]TKJ27218.1 MAG: sodium:proton antiporter [Hadesarchaea archaeon B3_Hades]
MAGMTVIVRTITRLLFPFTFLFGAYIVLHGHLTPGGGFPGGVIIAASVVMLLLAYGIERAETKVSFLQAEVLESIGGLAIVVLGLLSLLLGVAFLQNKFPLGELGQLFSAGNLPLLYLGVGIKVAAGILLIFYAMLFAFRGDEK